MKKQNEPKLSLLLTLVSLEGSKNFKDEKANNFVSWVKKTDHPLGLQGSQKQIFSSTNFLCYCGQLCGGTVGTALEMYTSYQTSVAGPTIDPI